jgi:nucleoid DNA-binding protein
MQSTVEIEGLGTFRVADRGRLGNGSPTHIDVAVSSNLEAYSVTGWRSICVTPPQE